MSMAADQSIGFGQTGIIHGIGYPDKDGIIQVRIIDAESAPKRLDVFA